MKVPPKRMITPIGKRIASQQFRISDDPEKAHAPIKRGPENGPGLKKDSPTPPTD